MIGVTHTVEALLEIRDDRSERLDDPVLLPGDALRLSHWTTGVCQARGRVLSARAAATAALACGAHVSASAAARMRIETHWLPQAPGLRFLHDGGDIVVVPDAVPRLMPLLPYVRHAVEEYLALRGNPTEGPLFVSSTGDVTEEKELRKALAGVGKLLGVKGNRLWHNLHMFFERGLDGETDRIAVGHLTGKFTWRRDRPGPEEARAPVDMATLRRILEATHPLAGPAKAHFGGFDPESSAVTGNLPARRRRIRKMSEAFESDPVVRELATIAWPDGDLARSRLRKEISARHLVHLAALKRAGKITIREIAYLLRCSPGAAGEALRRLPPPGAVIVKRTKAEWTEMLVARWRARPEGEGLPVFSVRMALEIGLPHHRVTAYRHLRAAGELKRRRGRPRKHRR